MDLILEMKKSVTIDFENFLYNSGIGYSDKIGIMMDKITFIDTASMYKSPLPIFQNLIKEKIFRVDGTR